ncbi:MAG: 16S rRNA (uracil(1498)-N(3))-methyltransferase [Chloroflexi bacterium]|nr:MAG: 16S rRNA (uracil(1498)-N(3))-methyltransferase [Chloroflexota bacterium]
MQRFFIPQPNGYQIDQTIVFSDEVAHQVRNVLRMGVGELVCVLDNEGGVYEVGVTAVSRNQVTGKILSKQAAWGEPDVQVTLYQSLTRREKFEWVLQKGTELGIRNFIPIVTQRSLVQDITIKPRKLARWQKIVMEAAEQSQRSIMPKVSSPLLFAEAIHQSQANDLSLIAWIFERGSNVEKDPNIEKDSNLKAVLNRWPSLKTVALFIGPEGGFAEAEIENGRSHGLVPFSLGPRVLRTETAALVASTLILHELGDLA